MSKPSHKILDFLTGFIVCLLSTFVPFLYAQEEDEANSLETPLENSIVGRDVALRLRLDAQLTDDSSDLIDSDPAYKMYPSRMFAGEAKVSQANKLYFTTSYESWNNPQDLQASLLGWTILSPVTETQKFIVKYKKWKIQDASDRNYFYAGINGFLGKVYSSLLYRYATTAGDQRSGEHQLSEYLSWAPSKRLRFGTQVAVSKSEESNLDPWYARFFNTIFLVEDWTSVRTEYQHYKYVTDNSFDEVKTHLYQRIGSKSLVRVGIRYCKTNTDITSLSPDIKLKHYFSPRFSSHVGYRYYRHNEGADFNTYVVGMGLVF